MLKRSLTLVDIMSEVRIRLPLDSAHHSDMASICRPRSNTQAHRIVMQRPRAANVDLEGGSGQAFDCRSSPATLLSLPQFAKKAYYFSNSRGTTIVTFSTMPHRSRTQRYSIPPCSAAMSPHRDAFSNMQTSRRMRGQTKWLNR